MQKYVDISCKLLQGKSEKVPTHTAGNVSIPASEYI